jgi:hypothetical protein
VYFPFPELTLIADLDFQHDQYYSDKLGFITANQAVLSWAVDPFGNRIQPTPGTTYLAFNADGTLQRIPQGSPRIGNGRGLWAENLRGGRIDYNTRLNGAAWIVDGVTVAQDMPTVYSNDATLAWSARATKDNATIYQNVLPIALGAGVNTSIPYALFRIPSGTALLGRVDFSVDNWVTSVNIAPRLNSQRWVQLAGPIQDLIAGNTLKYGLKFEKAGDKVGFMLGMADRGNVMRTPVETPSTPNVNVPGDFTTIRTENFSSMWDREEITVLIVCEPRADPLPDPTLQVGWTVFEMNNAYNIAAVGTGGIIDNVMTVATYTSGAFTEGTRMTVGTGVLSYTDIQRQLTPPDGPYGRQGTYLTSTTLSQHQTTSRQDIILQARIKDAQGNALNAATKPLDPIRPYARRIGLTATNELENVNTGDDPQNEDYNYNEPNAEGYTMNFRPADLYAASALKGDVQVFDTSPPHFTAAPVFNSTAQLALGCQGPYGGGSLNGPLSRIVIYGRAAAPPEMSKQTLALQIAAEQEIATLLAA